MTTAMLSSAAIHSTTPTHSLWTTGPMTIFLDCFLVGRHVWRIPRRDGSGKGAAASIPVALLLIGPLRNPDEKLLRTREWCCLLPSTVRRPHLLQTTTLMRCLGLRRKRTADISEADDDSKLMPSMLQRQRWVLRAVTT